MGKKHCPWENDVRSGLMSGCLTEALSSHISHCPVCRETVAVSRWMDQLKDRSLENPFSGKTFPRADEIWDSAHASPSIFKKELEKKVLRPLLIPRLLTLLSVIFAVLYIFTTQISFLKRYMNPLSSFFKMIIKSFSIMLLPVLLGLGAFFVFIIFAGFQTKKTHSL